MPRCTRCGINKPPSEFVKQSRSRSGLHTHCKPCFLEVHRESVQKHHGNDRNRRLKIRYGVDEGTVDRLLEEQGHCCAVCGEPNPRHVDHDHVTGKVRGVLCFNCNRALGYLGDSLKDLLHAAEYLDPLEMADYAS